MKTVILKRVADLPKRNMYAYTAKSVEEAVKKHVEMGGRMPARVWQWGSMYYMDPIGEDDAKG